METTTTYKKLLKDTARIVKHQKELSILKGEGFNVFSILKMESRENDTHSAFLGELLNPKGSHHLGPVFLKCFLKQLDIENHINVDTAKVVLEKFIGGRDDVNFSGGRIDIYIEDDGGNTVCIENKIYAADQNVQIARYCNHNPKKNNVYYLTLKGVMPTENSYKDKTPDKDFFTISYRIEILEWLEQCQKEATQFPILRESIHQYAILIKKLTNQLSDYKMEQEVKEIIIANYEAARIIAGSIENIELEYTEKFISEIVAKLKGSLTADFTVDMSETLNKSWTGIFIKNKNWPENVKIKLEGVTKIPWNSSIYGIHAYQFDRQKIKSALNDIPLLQEGFKETSHWAFYKTILDFSTTEQRARLFDIKERLELVEDITNKLIELSRLCEKPLAELKTS